MAQKDYEVYDFYSLSNAINDINYTEKTIYMRSEWIWLNSPLTIIEGQRVFIETASYYMQRYGICTLVTGTSNRHFIVKGMLTLKNLILDGSFIESGDRGGVQVNEGGVFTMQGGSKICNNQNLEGGGVYVWSDGLFLLEEGEISHNVATAGGGGVLVDEANFNMTGGSISYNEAPLGGGVNLINPSSTFKMSGGIISQNTSEEGGGVFIDGATVTMTKGEISTNEAANYGGGMVVSGSGKVTMSDESIINANVATSGGGIAVVGDEAIVTLTNGIVSTNKAEYGGGVYVSLEGSFIQNSGQISKNRAKYGGGVRLEEVSQFIMNNGIIISNKATHGGGGVYIDDTSSLTVDKGSITYNRAKSGGGIYTEDYETLTISEWAYFEKNSASGAFLYKGTYPNIKAAHSSIGNLYVLNNLDINYVDEYPLKKFSAVFPDYQLATAIAREFDVGPDDYTYDEELESLESLTAINFNIQNLTNIGALINLSYLDLSQNQISDLQPLSDLNLTTCILKNQTLTDKTVKVGEIFTSKILDKVGNPVTLVADIGDGEAVGTEFVWYEAGHNRLTWNYEDYYTGTIKQKVLKNRISNLFPDDKFADVIADLLNKGINSSINITELNGVTNLLADSQGIIDLTGIQLIPYLSSISLNDNLINDLTPLKNLKLTTLRLDYNLVSDVSSLASITNLQSLSLKYNQISNIESLNSLECLTSLNISHNKLENLQNLKLPRLITLQADSNEIKTISNLQLPKIRKLFLNHNKLINLGVLSSIATLEILELNDNELTTVSDLENLPILFVLELRGNTISDEEITLLQNLPNIIFLEWGEEIDHLT